MGLQHHAPLQGKAILTQAVPKALLLALEGVAAQAQQAAIVGEKAEVAAHIETEDRHIEGGQMAGRTEHGAIASQHQG